jgi:hypothetical protein
VSARDAEGSESAGGRFAGGLVAAVEVDGETGKKERRKTGGGSAEPGVQYRRARSRAAMLIRIRALNEQLANDLHRR